MKVKECFTSHGLSTFDCAMDTCMLLAIGDPLKATKGGSGFNKKETENHRL